MKRILITLSLASVLLALASCSAGQLDAFFGADPVLDAPPVADVAPGASEAPAATTVSEPAEDPFPWLSTIITALSIAFPGAAGIWWKVRKYKRLIESIVVAVSEAGGPRDREKAKEVMGPADGVLRTLVRRINKKNGFN